MLSHCTWRILSLFAVYSLSIHSVSVTVFIIPSSIIPPVSSRLHISLSSVALVWIHFLMKELRHAVNAKCGCPCLSVCQCCLSVLSPVVCLYLCPSHPYSLSPTFSSTLYYSSLPFYPFVPSLSLSPSLSYYRSLPSRSPRDMQSAAGTRQEPIEKKEREGYESDGGTR